MRIISTLLASALIALAAPAQAQSSYEAQVETGDFVIRDFKFGTGEVLPELNMHYATLGTPKRDADGRITNAVMILHGTGGTGMQFASERFADELYGPGQPLDMREYYIILPDNIGHGGSSKPSDGMRMDFPEYDYADMVEAQRRLLVDGLGVDRLRLLFGTSMGCMHGFMWGEMHPDFVRAMMPMACLPIEIAGLNRMWRKAAMEGIMSDPAWQEGNYETQPIQGLRTAVSLLQIAGGAPLYLQANYPTRETADAYIVERIEADIPTREANDLLYQLASSRNYNPWPGLEKIRTPMTWINSEDDFINPYNSDIPEKAMARIPGGRFVLIPATPETRGHSTHTYARFWKDEMVDLLKRTEAEQ